MADNSFKINKSANFNPQAGLPANPVDGDFFYDATAQSFSYYHNGNWSNFDSVGTLAGTTSLTSAQLTPAVVRNSVVKITGTGITIELHGITASFSAKRLTIYNNSDHFMIVHNQSATEPTANNRIATPTGGDLNLISGEVAVFIYDVVSSRWLLVSISSQAGAQIPATTSNNGIVTLHKASATPSTPTVLTDGDFNVAGGVIGLDINKSATISVIGGGANGLTATADGTGSGLSGQSGNSSGALGVYGVAMGGSGWGVKGESLSVSGGGVLGNALGNFPGIQGTSSSTTYAAVYGTGNSGTTATGILGVGGSTGGIGVQGQGNAAGVGVRGIGGTNTSSVHVWDGAGGYFTGASGSTGGDGVQAYAVGPSRSGVFGSGGTSGAGGYFTGGTNGRGVYAGGNGTAVGLEVDKGASTTGDVAIKSNGNMDLSAATTPTFSGATAQSKGANILTKKSFVKAWGVISTNLGSPTLLEGYNISGVTVSNTNQMDITLATGAADGVLMVQASISSISSSSQFIVNTGYTAGNNVRCFGYLWSGSSWTQCGFTSGNFVISFVVICLQ